MAMYIYPGDDGANGYSDEDIMVRQNAPYYRMLQRRLSDFPDDDWYPYMEFSSQYFAKLKRELESAGYEVTTDDYELWYSEPVGMFGVSNDLPGECFIFFVM
jgi:hypothetical protein